MDKYKKAGIRFNEELFINFEYDPETNTIKCYKNGVLINGGITPEELYIILQNYCTKEELQAVEAEIPDVADLATKSELQLVEAEIPDVSNLATKSELQAVEAEIPDVSNLATKSEVQAVEAEIPDVSNLATKSELQAVEADIPVIEYGKTSTIDASAGTYVDTTITFTKTFTNVPSVMATLVSNSTGVGSGNIAVSVINITNTGFTIRLFNNDTARRTPMVNWLAIEI